MRKLIADSKEEQKVKLWETVGKILKRCQQYNIPFKHLPTIMADLKVIPMLRGKALEFQVYEFLVKTLPHDEWEVHKYNVNPQPGKTDADLVVIHKGTGFQVVIECKHAVRGSFSTGKPKGKSQETRKPHFMVKSHKSRSNKERPETNDRYFVDEFDVIFTTAENAFIEKGDDYRIKDSDLLLKKYGIKNSSDALAKLADDLRLVVTKDIALEDDTLPRTPVVLLDNDPNWKSAKDEVINLFDRVIERKIRASRRRPSQPATRHEFQ